LYSKGIYPKRKGP